MELKLARDGIIFEESAEFPLIEVDKDKLKQIHSNEDEFKEMDVLVLDPKKFYLDFSEEVEEEAIEDFYKELRK